MGGQAIKLVVWGVNHIDNTSYPFIGCLEVTHNDRAISKLTSGKQGLLQGCIVFFALSTLYKGVQKSLRNWEVMLVLGWGCFLTKIFLPFDENYFYLPNDEIFLLASRIYPFVSQMTKILD